MVQLKVNIEKKHLWLLILVITAVGIAVATAPNPGHDVAEIGGLDDQIRTVVDPKLMNMVEGVLKVKPSNEPWETNQQISMASFTTTFGRGNGEYRGCVRAMTTYCQELGYSGAVPITDNCGWAVQQAASCPNAACNLEFFCLKKHTTVVS